MKVSIFRSIRTRLVVLLVGFITLAVLSGWFINRTFLEEYYIKEKTDVLIAGYKDMNKVFQSGDALTKEQLKNLALDMEADGISGLMVDSEFHILFSSGFGMTPDLLLFRLKDLLFDDKTDGEVIKKCKEYTIQRMHDKESGKDYLEICGHTSDQKNFFVMRTSLESIADAVEIANHFYLQVSLMIILVAALIMLIVSIRFTRPVMELSKLSRKMTNLDFSAKYQSSGSDEIAVLGQNMNQLSETLEETISELKSANVKLEADIRKKTEIDEMRKDFLSNVSHELKTPLALIQGYAEGLKEAVNDDPESRDFYCDVIIDEADKMNKMVQKLLTLNQIEFGNQGAEMERFDVIEVIDQVLNKSNLLLEEAGAAVYFDNQEKIYVWADEFQTEQVITNYVSNGIHYLAGEKKLVITPEDRGTLVRINVYNSGNPIPEEELDKIWIKFYKVDKARTREYGGNGIGLSIVRAIMDSMNMQCGVENQEGGVNFWFELEKDKIHVEVFVKK